MQFLNMLYGRKDIVNLIYWGIEGTHYLRVDGTENMVEFPEGIDRSNTPYAAILNVWGDKLKDYVMEPNDDGYVAMMQAFNNSISDEYKSDALGYCFNSEPVKTQFAAVNDVVTQYAKSTLGYGVVEPGPQLEEFLSALEAAGINEIIAENQKQFNEWKAAQ